MLLNHIDLFSLDSTLATSPIITNDPLNPSINPILTLGLFVAVSAATITASLGVIVSIPMVSLSSLSNPNFT